MKNVHHFTAADNNGKSGYYFGAQGSGLHGPYRTRWGAFRAGQAYRRALAETRCTTWYYDFKLLESGKRGGPGYYYEYGNDQLMGPYKTKELAEQASEERDTWIEKANT